MNEFIVFVEIATLHTNTCQCDAIEELFCTLYFVFRRRFENFNCIYFSTEKCGIVECQFGRPQLIQHMLFNYTV